MTETIIVALIVLVTVGYVARRLYLSLTGRSRGCACGTRQCELRATCASAVDPFPRRPTSDETGSSRGETDKPKA